MFLQMLVLGFRRRKGEEMKKKKRRVTEGNVLLIWGIKRTGLVPILFD